MRSWVTFDDARITRVVADIALTNVDVTLADNLQPLTLASLQGRVAQRVWGTDDGVGGQEFEATQLALVTTSKQAIAPLDFKLRTTRAKGAASAYANSSEPRRCFHARMVFTHVPFARELRETVSKHAIAGTLTDVTASWPGAAPELKTLTLKTKFQALASAAQPVPRRKVETSSARLDYPASKT